jgi:beta-phosphoglucomutase
MTDNKKAFLFDLNGTMIDDMDYHIRAWHRILNELGAGISMERMKEECYGKNHELLERTFPGRFTPEEKDKMSYEKEKEYQQQFKPHLQLLPGLKEFLQSAHEAGIVMAIGSAAIMFNIDFVLDNLGIRKYFDALVSADDVNASKPDPETYLICAERLHVSPKNCLVFEDSPKGVESAMNAGMETVVITILHTKEEFSGYSNIVRFINDYRGLVPGELVSFE